MRYTHRRAGARLEAGLLLAAMAMVMGCSDPVTGGASSSFEADVRGSRNERLTGSASASNGGDWSRESVVQVTLPQVGTFSGIILSSSDQVSAISIVRSGTQLPDGAHRIYGMPVPAGVARPAFTSAYVVRRTDGMQIFLADSGSVTLASTGNRVAGTFTLYASRYTVVEHPTPGASGQTLEPIASGNTPTTITGSFDASRR